MTCEQVRELLPEFLLGSLDDVAAADVRRHLRGCAACREEQAKLEEGIDALSRAAHDREPPEELRARVLGVLGDEWRDETSTPASTP
ncbi:MAG TPA: zf-HC2 domain-containing protein, partial [Actinomycetota bacterium]